MPGRNPNDRFHRGNLTEEMDDDDRPGTRRDGRLDRFRADVHGNRIDVHEHRSITGVVHRPRRGKEGEWRGDHLVSGPEIERYERYQDYNGPAGAGNAVLSMR